MRPTGVQELAGNVVKLSRNYFMKVFRRSKNTKIDSIKLCHCSLTKSVHSVSSILLVTRSNNIVVWMLAVSLSSKERSVFNLVSLWAISIGCWLQIHNCPHAPLIGLKRNRTSILVSGTHVQKDPTQKVGQIDGQHEG